MLPQIQAQVRVGGEVKVILRFEALKHLYTHYRSEEYKDDT
jgi:uncharacterized protein (DUF1330 family)